MMGHYLLRGMIAGLIAGILAFGIARVWGEPPVEAAIAIEEAASAAEEAHDHDHGDEGAAGHSHGEDAGFSRQTQAGIGLLTGMAVFGAGLGGLFALVFALVEGRFSRLRAQGTAMVMAGLGYVSVVLVPFLKYPANPPAVGDGDTIGLRTQLYFTMMALSVLAMAISVAVARGTGERWRGGIAGGALYLVLVTIAGHVLPTINEVPGSFPGDLLWQFRTISLLVEAALWTALGLIFGLLVQRLPEAQPGLRRQLG